MTVADSITLSCSASPNDTASSDQPTRTTVMKRVPSLLVLLCAAMVANVASAQSTISDDTWDLSLGKGVWGALLPSYSPGITGGGESALQSDGDNPGAIWELGAIRHFHGTRTSLEARGFFALALSNSNDTIDTLGLFGPTTGLLTIAPGNLRTHLDADTFHWGFDISLRDTWRTDFGGLSAGLGLSQMAINQNFVSTITATTSNTELEFLDESVDSFYLGGIGFVGWDGYLFGRASNLDLTFGYYNLDSEYEVDFLGTQGALERSDHAYKVALDGTTRFCLGGRDIGLTLGATYISDITVVERVSGSPVVLGTEDGVLINASVEWLY